MVSIIVATAVWITDWWLSWNVNITLTHYFELFETKMFQFSPWAFWVEQNILFHFGGWELLYFFN